MLPYQGPGASGGSWLNSAVNRRRKRPASSVSKVVFGEPVVLWMVVVVVVIEVEMRAVLVDVGR